jgi:glycine cleavage system H protein
MINLYYSQTHEWVRVEGDIATMGITDFAAQQLSDLIFVNLPKVGSVVKQNEPMGEIESVKTVVDINSPVSGTIIEVNEPILSNLNLVSTDPFGNGWMTKIKCSDKSELQNLLTNEAYQKLCDKTGSETH